MTRQSQLLGLLLAGAEDADGLPTRPSLGTGPAVRSAGPARDHGRAPTEEGAADPPSGSPGQAFRGSSVEMAEQVAGTLERDPRLLRAVSHELKTPLTAIRGYAEGLREGVFTAQEAGDPILVEARRLERLVRDLLDLTRISSHDFSARSGPTDLAAVARTAVARHHATAHELGISLGWNGQRRLVEADHDRVLQIASNLVENALRGTPPSGSVTVETEPGGLHVSETGPGLAAVDLPRAFDCFYLYDKQRRDRHVGSGLSLAIVKQLARAMGGDVSVTSRPGRGTQFAVSLRPLGEDSTAAIDPR